MHRQRKGFAGFDQTQKQIDDIKAQISELKKSLDDPEQKALSERYTAITKELDEIRAEQDSAFKNFGALRDQKRKAQQEQQEKWLVVKEIKDNYFQARRANQEYEREAKRQRWERHQQERKGYEAEKRKAIARQKLDEASTPAYGDEIVTAESLIRYFDPSSAPVKTESGPGKFAASAQRSVDDSGIKGMRVVKKEEDDYFIGGGGKKKKGKKGPEEKKEKINLDYGLLEQLSKMDLKPPTSKEDYPELVEKLKEKLGHWKGDQDRQTKEVSLCFRLENPR